MWWPAINPKTGEIWVANSFGDEYWIFDRDGTFKEAWGVAGKAPGQFDFSAHRPNPQAVGGIAFAPDGSFYVADIGNRRIQHFDADRGLLGLWGTFGAGDGQFVSPFGIATDGQTVYVADDDRGDVQAFSSDGTYLRTFGDIITEAGIFIALAPDGTLYRSGGPSMTIAKYGSDGTDLGTIQVDGGDGVVLGLAVDSAGNLFANIDAASPALVEFGPTGAQIAAWSFKGETMAIDPEAGITYQANEESPASLAAFAFPEP
jgi:tripartite motif-containing protein 71